MLGMSAAMLGAGMGKGGMLQKLLAQMQGQGGAQGGDPGFETGDMAGQADAQYGTIGQVPPDVMMARWSQFKGQPMGGRSAEGGTSFAQRGRGLRDMAEQYRSLTTQVGTQVDPQVTAASPWKNWASQSNRRGGFFRTGRRRRSKWKAAHQQWMSGKGAQMRQDLTQELTESRGSFFGGVV